MPHPDNLGDLTPEEWTRLEDLATRFEQALRSGNDVELSEFLPPSTDPLRRVVLLELIKVELEARWRRGQATYLEAYLAQFPELGTATSLPPPLIYEEYRIRQRYGDRPALTTYQDRFPAQFPEVQRLAAVLRSGLTPHTPSPSLLGDTNRQGNIPSPSGDWKRIRHLGTGAFGEVWEAEAPGGVRVAVKIIRPAADAETTEQERAILGRMNDLTHPFLLKNFAWWSAADQLFVAMELAEGTLRDRLKECREQKLEGIPPAELLKYMSESAAALDHLHKRGHLQHRDVKPENILLLGGFAKVGDFGLARPQESQRIVTADGAGTPRYMSPEVWRGQSSPHSDQYSLAATYVELRRHRPPFSGKSLPELMFKHLEQPPDLSGLPEAEQAVLYKALAKDPWQRFPSCQAFVETLREAVNPKPPPSPPAPPPFLWLIVLVLGLAVAAVALYGTQLLVKPPSVVEVLRWRPFNWQPDSKARLRLINGVHLYDRLVREIDGQQVVCLLIPKTRSPDPAPFYILKDKVTNRLYSAFLRERPAGDAHDWMKRVARFAGPELPDNHPVFFVTVDEAHAFAQWLGGETATLPSLHQWLKAAGKDDVGQPDAAGKGHSPDGPFLGAADNLKSGDIAIFGKPMPVGTAPRDESIWHCRDMAGNGLEWTRTEKDGKDVPFSDRGQRVEVRLLGQSCTAGEPFRFKDVNAKPELIDGQHYRANTSFRLVIEIPPTGP